MSAQEQDKASFVMELPSMTKVWHNKTYPAIDPKKPSLSAAGKTIFITGGGTGIGVEITRSFATAGAPTIAISGRTQKTLLATKKSIESSFPHTKILTFVADSSDEKAVEAAFRAVGHVDVLVNNAGFMAELELIAASEPANWWKAFEVNVLGAYLVTRAFLKVAAPKDAVLIELSTGATVMPATPTYSSYQASKLAATKFFDVVGAEHPEIRVMNVHPGVVETAMGSKSLDAGAPFPIDEVSLPADYVVWAASPEAAFLKGRLVYANWDVEELVARTKEIEEGNEMTLGLIGYPYMGYTSKSNDAVKTNGTNGTNGVNGH